MQIQNLTSQQVNFKVVVRVRPLNQRGNTGIQCLETHQNQIHLIQSQRFFQFDYVYDSDCIQDQIFNQCVTGIVMRCFERFKSPLLAYWQLRSEKTFTIGTSSEEQHDVGMTPVQSKFQEIDRRKQELDTTITRSYLELYNEQIIDLLVQNSDKFQPIIREEKNTHYFNFKFDISCLHFSKLQAVNPLERCISPINLSYPHELDQQSIACNIYNIFSLQILYYILKVFISPQLQQNVPPITIHTSKRSYTKQKYKYTSNYTLMSYKISLYLNNCDIKGNQILLGFKKRGFGVGKYNGFGGKVGLNESIIDAAIRETQEEANITPKDIVFQGLIIMKFDIEPELFFVHIFKATKYDGIIQESEEMEPKWFKIDEIPFNKMWVDDIIWIPWLLKDQFFQGFLEFKGYEAIINNTLQVVDQQQLVDYGLNKKPLIGVLTVPSELDNYDDAKYSTLDASYVKYVESGGAIVIPIQWDASYDELNYILRNINGVLLTGGDTLIYLNETQPGFNFNKFTDTVTFILNKAIQFNKEGNVFPIFGICQGFQVLNYVVSLYEPVLEPVEDNLQKQRLLRIVKPDSYLLKPLGTSLQFYLENVLGPFQYNHWAVFEESYQKYTLLDSFFDITSYSYDEVEKEYIASIEAKEYPFYAVQFHPEKHQFEFNSPVKHYKELVQFGQTIINQFINKARLNVHTLPDQEINKRSIYNFKYEFVNLEDQTGAYIFERKLNEGFLHF
ncbi:hypothetical protein pb186bvf_020392 [Paramecium bursaria]